MSLCVEFGTGLDIDTRAETDDIAYACDTACQAEIVRKAAGGDEAAAVLRGEAERFELGPALYTDGSPTGYVNLAVLSCGEPPYHVWCGACGERVSHGSGDGDPYECDAPFACDSPEFIDPAGASV